VKYLATICVAVDPNLDPDEVAAVKDETRAWVERHERRGVLVTGSPLAPATEARTVKVRAGARLVTEGPFAESREVMAGFDLFDCDSVDEAIAIAADHPMARYGEIEVWPLSPHDV
jgi:hypothetical protein